ncbi:hypothetical protein GCM10010994_03820 [Chelatococcus reniformis]|uniref:Uncharacterized protein n=1 Tax=Chelatococcus reniformis TaxID=1494448 RepID=A0A916TWW0_9HYPH|nr:hypothetical protein GCM10010994_03820 [Chelatococcus reniformis]
MGRGRCGWRYEAIELSDACDNRRLPDNAIRSAAICPPPRTTTSPAASCRPTAKSPCYVWPMRKKVVRPITGKAARGEFACAGLIHTLGRAVEGVVKADAALAERAGLKQA